MASEVPEVHRITPQFTLLNAVSITTGSIIGSGIFISPKGVFQSLGSVAMSFIVWIICGIISLFANLCFVELSVAMPKFGGEYLYLRTIYGNFPAFFYQWLSLTVMLPSAVAIVSLTCSEYVLQPLFGGCEIPTICLKLLSMVIILFSAYLNVFSVRTSAMVVEVLMVAKFLALGIIIVTGIITISTGKSVLSLENSFDGVQWRNIGLSFYVASWSYSGGDSIMSMTEEFTNPKRDFPRSSLISYLSIICTYLLANVAYFAVLTPDEMLLSDAVAVTFAEKTLGVFAWLIPVFVGLSTFGSITISIMSTPRSYFASARDGMLPSMMCLVGVKNKTPVVSICVASLLSVVYLYVDRIWTLLSYYGFVSSCCDVLALSTIIYMRYFRSDIHKPFKVPILLPLIVMVCLISVVILNAISAPIDALVGLALTLTVVPVYLVFVYPKTKLNMTKRLSRMMTLIVQKISISAHEEQHE